MPILLKFTCPTYTGVAENNNFFFMQTYLKPILIYQNENQGSDCHLYFLDIYEISGNVNKR